MTEQRIYGIIREFLSLGAAVAVSFGLGDGSVVAIVSGILVQTAVLAWAVASHQGLTLIGTVARKLIQAAVPLGVAFEWVTPEQSATVLSLLAFSVAAIWSIIDNGEPDRNPPYLP